MANTTGKKFGGRTKGTPNKVTNDIREAYKKLLDKNIDNLDKWLNEIAKTSPARAFDIILRLSEFVIPKINRGSMDLTIGKAKEIDLTDEEINAEINRLTNER